MYILLLTNLTVAVLPTVTLRSSGIALKVEAVVGTASHRLRMESSTLRSPGSFIMVTV